MFILDQTSHMFHHLTLTLALKNPKIEYDSSLPNLLLLHDD